MAGFLVSLYLYVFGTCTLRGCSCPAYTTGPVFCPRCSLKAKYSGTSRKRTILPSSIGHLATTMISNLAAGDFHPDFGRVSKGIVLVSKEGVRFGAPTRGLSQISAFFSTMLSLPQGKCAPGSGSEPVHMGEDADTVSYIVALARNQSLPDLSTSSQVYALLRAAEKYEMPVLTSIMRLALRGGGSSRPIPFRPVERYVLAVRYGWDDVRKEARTAWLGAPMDLDVDNGDFALLQKLIVLRQRRVEAFRDALDNRPQLSMLGCDDLRHAQARMRSFPLSIYSAVFWRLKHEFACDSLGGFITRGDCDKWPEWEKAKGSDPTPFPRYLLSVILEYLPDTE
ncbi:hypothetical protein EXIGLDRAFT_833338 [Exidia glandulosa HHB12029]|uniref:BTB domain-containing protein n=1 Tax=Exidia glandulosa HHB12029 TaxID=1314781 RepID=A0A165KRL4_EXIGL|nr:hypothetical protein EXIGLDRAFT_833338 [Exidia glandulosa HHB12029]